MARKKKDGEHINLYVDRVVVEKLRDYAEDKGQTVTMALERILTEFFNNEENAAADGKKNENVRTD